MNDPIAPNKLMPLRVMTYNILDGGEGRENYLLEVLQTVKPDVAILLSRLPVISCQSHHRFPPIWHNVIEAEIEYQPDKRLWLFGIHPVANLSVIWELWRWWEAKHIIGRVKPYTAEPCLVAGDFNATAPDDRVAISQMPQWLRLIILTQGNRVYRFSIRKYLAVGLTDCFRAVHPDDDGFTLPPPQPNSRLDYILVNDVLKSHLIDCRVVREPSAILKASDHYPVVAEFQM